MTTSNESTHRHRRTLTLSTVSSVIAICVVILPLIGWASKGTVINVLSDAMAGEIQAKVKKEVAPINGGFRVLLENGIAELEDEIARLEYRRDNDENFTQLDAQDLTTKKRRLAKNREALAVLKNASNGTADG